MRERQLGEHDYDGEDEDKAEVDSGAGSPDLFDKPFHNVHVHIIMFLEMNDDAIKFVDDSESTQVQDEADEDAVTSSGLSETPKKKKKKLKKQVKEVDVQRVTVSTSFRLEFCPAHRESFFSRM